MKRKSVSSRSKTTADDGDYAFNALNKLKKMLDSGVITQDDYDTKKQELLGKI
jgi:hypothetical protein